MCIKYIYRNMYDDGTYSTTEDVEPCSVGHRCTNPRVKTYDILYEHQPQRQTDRPLSSSPRYYSTHGQPLSPPDSPAFGGSGSGSNDAGRHRTDIFINSSRGTRLSSSPSPSHITGRRSSIYSPYDSPRFSSTRPIPIGRTSNIRTHGLDTPPLDRGRRPIVVEDRIPRIVTKPASPTPIEVLEYASSHPYQRRHHRASSDSSRRYSMTAADDNETFLSPRRRLHSDYSLRGYGSAEDDTERSGRYRRQQSTRDRVPAMSSSFPAYDKTDVFGSSYESSASGGGFGSPPVASSHPTASSSPAVAAAKKELRWEDEQRRKQNERISARPKLDRSQTVRANTRLHGEVKSILKNADKTTTSPIQANTTSRRSSQSMSPPNYHSESRSRRASVSTLSRDDVLNSFNDLGIYDRGSSQDRLRDRFNRLPQDYSTSASSRYRP